MAEIAANAIVGDQNQSTTAAAPTSGGDTAEDEDHPDSCQWPKRQKKCPKALENIVELAPSKQRCSSFTFDTKSNITCGQEITPKFGSFNLSKEPAKEKDQGREILVNNKEGQQEQEQEEAKDVVAGFSNGCVDGTELVADNGDL